MFNFGGFAKGIASFISASQQAKSQKAWAKYENTMRALQAAEANNNITANIVEERSAETAAKLIVQGNALKASASAEVSAATVGASGGSVEATLFDIGRNEAKKLNQTGDQYDASVRSMEAQRRQIAINLAVGKKHVGRGPSPVGLLFGALGGAMSPSSARTSSGTNGLLV